MHSLITALTAKLLILPWHFPLEDRRKFDVSEAYQVHVACHLQACKLCFLPQFQEDNWLCQATKTYLRIIHISLAVSFLLAPMHVVCSVVRQGGDEEEQRPQAQRHAAAIPFMAVWAFAVRYQGEYC